MKRQNGCTLAGLSLLIWSGYAMRAQAINPIVGRLLNVLGTVSIRHGAQGALEDAGTCTPLRVGDMIVVAKGARADVCLRKDGRRFALAANSKTEVTHDRKTGQENVKGRAGMPPHTLTRIGRHLAQTELEGANLAATRIRSDSKGPHYPSPLGCVPTSTPTLYWQNGTAVGEAAKLTLTIVQGEQSVLSQALPANATQFVVPNGKLKPGQWYTWVVTAQVPGESLFCSGPLRVQTPEDAGIVQTLEEEAAMARTADPKDPSPDVLLAEGYEELGQFSAALTAWRTALAKCPDDPALKYHKNYCEALNTLVPTEEPRPQPPSTVQEPPNKAEKLVPPTLTPELQEINSLYEAGLMAAQKRDYFAAIKSWQLGLEKSQALQDEKHTAYFINNLAIVYGFLRQFDKALDYHTRALHLWEKLKNSQYIATNLTNLGNIYDNLSQFDKALDYHTRALTLYEQLKNPSDIARGLNNLGTAYNNLSQFNKALDYHTRALHLREKLNPPHPEEIASSLYNLGIDYSKLGQYDEALDYHTRALHLREKFEGTDKIVASLNNLGALCSKLGQLDKALDYNSRALTLYEQLKNPSDIAHGLSNLGVVYYDLDQFEKARGYFIRAQVLFEQLKNPNDIASGLSNLGNVYFKLSQFDNALDYHTRAQALFEKLNNSQDFAFSLTSLGNIYSSLGQFDKALDYLTHALNLREKFNNFDDIAISRNNRSIVYGQVGQLDKALDDLTYALNLWEKFNNPPGIAHGLNNLGIVYFKLGQFEKARGYFIRAQVLFEQLKNPSDIARGLSNLGTAYNNLSQFNKALDYHTRAQALFEQLKNPNDIAFSLSNLGAVYVRLHRVPEADAAYLRALSLHESVSHQVTDAGEIGAYQKAHQDTLYARYAELKRQEQKMPEALALLERGRAQGLAKQAAQNRVDLSILLTPADAIQLRQREDSLKLVERQWQALQQRHAPDAQIAEAKRQYEEAVKQWSAFRNGLFAQTRYAVYRRLQGAAPPTAPQLLAFSSSSHHRDTLYLEYGVVDDKTLLLCALRNGKIMVYSLPIVTKTLAGQIEQWRENLSNIPIANAEEPKQARILYDSLLGNVEKAGLLKTVKHLVIVADGPLLDVPFAALLDGKNTRLITQVPISSAFSIASLAWKDTQRPPTGSLLCYADPFGGESKIAQNSPSPLPAALTRRGEDMVPLLSARQETEALIHQVAGAKAYFGSKATENAVQKESGKYALLHFATHGVIDGLHGLLSFLALSDGTLNGQDIVKMKLSAHLATLSACKTARGQKSGGDGLIGLAWAFRAAGVPAIVASQWSVDDEATSTLMQVFYKQLLAGKPKDEALQRAMKTVMQDKPRPSFWAAFEIIGDPVPVHLPTGHTQTARR